MGNSQVIALVAIAISVISIGLVVANVFNLQNILITLNTSVVEQSQIIKSLNQQQNATQQVIDEQSKKIAQMQDDIANLTNQTKSLQNRVTMLEQKIGPHPCMIPEGCPPPFYGFATLEPCSTKHLEPPLFTAATFNNSRLIATNVTKSVIEAAFTHAADPYSNYQGKDLIVKCHTEDYGGIDNRKAWLKFNLPVAPPQIKHATLRVYLTSIELKSSAVDIYREDNNTWSQNSITYNNEPAHFASLSSGPFAEQTMNSVNQYYGFDVTNAIVSSPGGQTITLVLVGNSLNDGVSFAGNKNTATAPKLMLSY